MSGVIAAAAQWGSAILMLLKLAGFTYLFIKLLNFVNTIRDISFYFDRLLLRLIEKVYEYFKILVNGEFFDAETLAGFASRIYLFIGIIIFFKLAIVIIKKIGNPDSVTDEKSGLGGSVKKISTGLILIVIIPLCFDMALKLQGAILKDNVIQFIITGEKTSEETNSRYTPGANIGYTVFSGFMTANNSTASETQKRALKRASDFKDADMIDADLLTEEKGGEYVIDYFPIVSTLALGYILFMLLTMTLNVVVRIVELGILQMISPIIIVDYMVDSGQNTFGNWFKASVSAYVKIFIDVAMLWFIIFILSYLTDPTIPSPLIKANQNDNMLIALIVLGLFLFSKKLPSIISKIFGVELDSSTADFLKGLPGKALGVGKKAFGITKKIGSSALNTGRHANRFAQGFKGAAGASGGFGKGNRLKAFSSGLGAGVRAVPNKAVKSLTDYRKEMAATKQEAADRYNIANKAKEVVNPMLKEQGNLESQVKANNERKKELIKQRENASVERGIEIDAEIIMLNSKNRDLTEKIKIVKEEIRVVSPSFSDDIETISSNLLSQKIYDKASTLKIDISNKTFDEIKEIVPVYEQAIKLGIKTEGMSSSQVKDLIPVYEQAINLNIDTSKINNVQELNNAIEKIRKEDIKQQENLDAMASSLRDIAQSQKEVSVSTEKVAKQVAETEVLGKDE